MKKVLRTIIAAVLFTAIILAGCETADGGICIPWTIGWMAVAIVSAIVLDKTSKSKENV